MPTVGVFAAIFDERKRILCVKRSYGPRNWTTPGGRIENAESPVEALEREVEEETGYVVQATRVLGVYSATFKDDLVLSIEAKLEFGTLFQESLASSAFSGSQMGKCA